MTTPTTTPNSELGTRRFDAQRRLTDAPDYDRVFKRAKRRKDEFFTVLYRPNGYRHARLGLAVAKKNCRKAHARNRIKRIVRESFRLNQHRLSGRDIVVLCTTAAPRATNGRLFASLDRFWQHLDSRPPAPTGR